MSWDSKADDSDSVPSLCRAEEGGGVVLGVSLVRPEVVDLGLGNGSAGRRCLAGVGKTPHPPILFHVTRSCANEGGSCACGRGTT